MIINMKTEVKITDSDFVKELRRRLYIEDYKIIDGTLHEYQRVSWSDYEYRPINPEDAHVNAWESIELIEKLEALLNIEGE